MSIKVNVNGYTLGHFKRTLGKLLTLIDASIVDEKQNKAVKDSVKSIVWNMWDFEASFSEEKDIENPTAVEENSLQDEE